MPLSATQHVSAENPPTPDEDRADRGGARARGQAAARRGRVFEMEVFIWLDSTGWFTFIRPQQRIRPKTAMMPYTIDFLGTVYRERWARFAKVVPPLGMLFPIAGLVATPRFGEGWMMAGLFGMFLWVLVTLKIGGNRIGNFTWIECRDRDDPVSRAYVQEVVGRRADAGELAPARTLIVSANGFEEDAVLVAQANQIECWERNEEGVFERRS